MLYQYLKLTSSSNDILVLAYKIFLTNRNFVSFYNMFLSNIMQNRQRKKYLENERKPEEYILLDSFY